MTESIPSCWQCNCTDGWDFFCLGAASDGFSPPRSTLERSLMGICHVIFVNNNNCSKNSQYLVTLFESTDKFRFYFFGSEWRTCWVSWGWSKSPRWVRQRGLCTCRQVGFSCKPSINTISTRWSNWVTLTTPTPQETHIWATGMTYFYLSADNDNIDIDTEQFDKFPMGEKLLVVYSVSVDAHSNVSHSFLFCSEKD